VGIIEAFRWFIRVVELQRGEPAVGSTKLDFLAAITRHVIMPPGIRTSGPSYTNPKSAK
jgi:hypothetical protein